MTINEKKYDELVFENAGRLASRAGRNGKKLRRLLLEHCYNNHFDACLLSSYIEDAVTATESTNFTLVNYRGVFADEGVIECIKEMLRETHGSEYNEP